MYCTLIKKVNITRSEKLTKIATNKTTNYIGIGGTNGFVQIVNLDVTRARAPEGGAPQSQLSFSQIHHSWHKVIYYLTHKLF